MPPKAYLPLLAAYFLSGASVKGANLEQLEARQYAISKELATLAEPTLNVAVGPIGLRSKHFQLPGATKQIELRLKETALIDQVVLVPTLHRITNRVVSYGFPQTLKIIVGQAEDSKGRVVKELSGLDAETIGVAPVILDFEPIEADWIRIEASDLAYNNDGHYFLQLSELIVFSGKINVAVDASIVASVPTHYTTTQNSIWAPEYLVDSILPYVMDGASSATSPPYMSSRIFASKGKSIYIDVDLEVSQKITGIRLFAYDQNETFPQGFPVDYGFPRKFRIIGSDTSDFTQGATLLEATINRKSQVGPIKEWKTAYSWSRYIRMIVDEPFIEYRDKPYHRLAISEIEILSDGRNVASGKPASASLPARQTGRSFSVLTDGLNSYGEILTTREWMRQLARRHQLEVELNQVMNSLAVGYEHQKTLLRRSISLALFLGLSIAILSFVFVTRRRVHETRIRERIAANLHDELGANLHAIGMLGDIAEESVDTPERLVESVRRIRDLTERTGKAVRECTNMLQASEISPDLALELKKDCVRILSGMEVEFSIEDEAILNALSRRKRIDLSLFHKECLMNILKHAKATAVWVRLRFIGNELELSVRDNGSGLDGTLPKALSRRAKLLNGTVNLNTPETRGTEIVLRMPLKGRRFLI